MIANMLQHVMKCVPDGYHHVNKITIRYYNIFARAFEKYATMSPGSQMNMICFVDKMHHTVMLLLLYFQKVCHNVTVFTPTCVSCGSSASAAPPIHKRRYMNADT